MLTSLPYKPVTTICHLPQKNENLRPHTDMNTVIQSSLSAVYIKKMETTKSPSIGDLLNCSIFAPWMLLSRGGHDNPLQYFFLEKPLDRGAWWATVHRVAKSGTGLKRLSMHIAQTCRWIERRKEDKCN